jgi:AAA+ ATPase superfamily predicted ATPase
MNVIFGATSVGKTALLRQVLAGDDFYVITFDLRISGFADLRSLYIALCQQFRNVFEEVRNLAFGLSTTANLFADAR